MSVHGWIILDKPLGLGSTQAVSAVKRNLREAGFRPAGHRDFADCAG
jgi:tRNA pseudouridine55 synthase